MSPADDASGDSERLVEAERLVETDRDAMPLDQPEEAPFAMLPKVDPESLVLRARPARAIRFKRSAIVSLVAIAAVTVAGTAWFALEPRSIRFVASGDDSSPIAKSPADTLSELPTGYGAVPKLGPPLPGDLGRPILDRQRQIYGETVQPGGARDQAAALERQQRAEAIKAARQSALLVTVSDRGGKEAPTVTTPVAGAALDAAPQAKLALDPQRDPNGQQTKSDFATSNGRLGDTNRYPLVPARSPNTLFAGTVIAASLITGLRSDLPGLVTAQVTERVYDSATGRIQLIPQGARLLGSYDSVVAFGQKRALVVWQRILLPDGSSVRLDNAPATDPSGYAGLEDKVDFHTWTLLKGVVLSTILGVGAELQFSGQSDLVQALRQSTQQGVSRAGDQLTSRNLQIQPTITIRPGTSVRLLVHQDLVLAPWRDQR